MSGARFVLGAIGCAGILLALLGLGWAAGAVVVARRERLCECAHRLDEHTQHRDQPDFMRPCTVCQSCTDFTPARAVL